MLNEFQVHNMVTKPLGLVPLDVETRATLPTSEAARHLNRANQTLLLWSCKGGPISPVRINGRLAWRVDDIRRLVGAGS